MCLTLSNKIISLGFFVLLTFEELKEARVGVLAAVEGVFNIFKAKSNLKS